MDTEKRRILIAFVYVSGFVAILVIYFFIKIYRQHSRFRKLQKVKLNAEIAATALERTAIANQLHNDLGPYLSSITMRLQLIETAQQHHIEDCTQAVAHCVKKIRAMTRVLSPISLHELSFQTAIKQYIKEFKVSEVISIEFIEKDPIELLSEQHNQVYQILQEIIHNAVKHSKGKTLQIEVSKEKNNLLIRTKDDGVGFDETDEKVANKITYGLLSIQNRVDFLQGSIVKASQKGQGTKYNIRIPLSS
jgi:signal transduction histidine kinase